MTPGIALLLLFVLVILLVGALFAFGLPVSGTASNLRSNMKTIVKTQRTSSAQREEGSRPSQSAPRSVLDSAVAEDDDNPIKYSDSKLTLRKKLKYAQWQHVPPFVFSLSQIVVSFIAFLFMRVWFDTLLQIVSLVTGPVLLNGLLSWKINKRFETFDGDYPQFLLSLVGLLKTGMNPVQALEASAAGLDEGSMVRLEVELMLERMRLGVQEERSIGSFGEDILHPEIELFVQALLLSRRVGGTLSDTLERLAKQVRKRQYFRRSANAAVGMQRGSIWAILGILVALLTYIWFSWREVLVVLWTHPTGKMVAQGSIALVLFGIYWIRQVTKIRT
jgi:tight adherence protein B